MDTKSVQVFYKTVTPILSMKIDVGYGTQGTCIVNVPQQAIREELDVAVTNSKSYAITSNQVLLLGKYFPAPGKTTILVSISFYDGTNVLHREAIEKTVNGFERFSHVFTISKEPVKPA